MSNVISIGHGQGVINGADPLKLEVQDMSGSSVVIEFRKEVVVARGDGYLNSLQIPHYSRSHEFVLVEAHGRGTSFCVRDYWTSEQPDRATAFDITSPLCNSKFVRNVSKHVGGIIRDRLHQHLLDPESAEPVEPAPDKPSNTHDKVDKDPLPIEFKSKEPQACDVFWCVMEYIVAPFVKLVAVVGGCIAIVFGGAVAARVGWYVGERILESKTRPVPTDLDWSTPPLLPRPPVSEVIPMKIQRNSSHPIESSIPRKEGQHHE
jgi:hypothetical protein